MTAARSPRQRILVCEDDFLVDYSINPWMKPAESNAQLATAQWHKMVATLKQYADVTVAHFPADAPEEVFWTRDGYGIVDGKIVLANFRYAERQAETASWREWFHAHGYETVETTALFEGGNVVQHGNSYFVAIGDRADPEDPDQLSQQFGVEFVGLPVTSDDFFHLDVAMLSLGKEVLLYRDAFTPAAQAILRERLPEAIELSKDEMLGFCANSIALGDTIVIPAGQKSFRAKLEAIGKQVVEVNLSAFIPIGGGGVHCLTNVLPDVIE